MALKIYDTIQTQGDYPAVTADQVEMPDGTRLDNFKGGVASWNDLTDKPFYEEEGLDTLFPEQEISGFQIHPVYQLPIKLIKPAPFLLVPGETYQVKWKEVTYTCVAIDGSAVIPGAVGIGNAYAFGYPNTGEPFAIISFSNTNELGIAPLDGSDAVNVGIFQEGLVVTPLDAKYLPMEAIDERINAHVDTAMQKIETMTQAEYDALVAAGKEDAGTIYMIVRDGT